MARQPTTDLAKQRISEALKAKNAAKRVSNVSVSAGDHEPTEEWLLATPEVLTAIESLDTAIQSAFTRWEYDCLIRQSDAIHSRISDILSKYPGLGHGSVDSLSPIGLPKEPREDVSEPLPVREAISIAPKSEEAKKKPEKATPGIIVLSPPPRQTAVNYMTSKKAKVSVVGHGELRSLMGGEHKSDCAEEVWAPGSIQDALESAYDYATRAHEHGFEGTVSVVCQLPGSDAAVLWLHTTNT